MPTSLTRKIIDAHLAEGDPSSPANPIALRIDQTLTQDATGTLVMLHLERLGLDRVKTELSAQYVDHNLLQEDFRNPDDHLFLESASRRFGVHFARPGTGVSHPVHMMRFGRPGATLLGSDSHTCAAGSLGMLAMGAGGLDVAAAMAGEPARIPMPAVWGVRLTGALPPFVSAKDVILEMLRRHGVRGGVGRVIEYYGPGLACLTAMDRHVIANMGAELGATGTIFPSDEETRRFLARCGREGAFEALAADEGAPYDHDEHIDLAALEPLIAKPSSPGNVVPVREIAGAPIYQAYIGSSANPGYRDFAVAAHMVAGRSVAPTVSFDINPTSRQLLQDLLSAGLLEKLIAAGARLHQPGCNGCIGMGQAPASGRNSLRTVPRNFPGRSGTPEDAVFLCSPETAAASALAGAIADPRDLALDLPTIPLPERLDRDAHLIAAPPDHGTKVTIVRGPNVVPIPKLDPLPKALSLAIELVVGDDVSTDEILPAGARVLPYRSNIPKIAEFCFEALDPEYAQRTRDRARPHAIVAGNNYGQGSSREHAALAPRYLGLRAVIATSFARIHRDNLVGYGVLPLLLDDAPNVLPKQGTIELDGLDALAPGEPLVLRVGDERFEARHDLTEREVEEIRAGGRLERLGAAA